MNPSTTFINSSPFSPIEECKRGRNGKYISIYQIDDEAATLAIIRTIERYEFITPEFISEITGLQKQKIRNLLKPQLKAGKVVSSGYRLSQYSMP